MRRFSEGLREFLSLDKFKLVYWVIAIATAQHTAWGAAITMQGNNDGRTLFWWVQGYLFAIGIDYSMVMIATKIRTGGARTQHYGIGWLRVPVNWYAITFATVAAFSIYFQLLYAWEHADQLNMGLGVADEWQRRLQGLINARIVIAPLALPTIAVLYTIGGLGKGGEAQPRNRNRATVQPQVAQPESIRIERPATPLLGGHDTAIRNHEGKVVGHTCPGCGKELSVSGWSRHKNSCDALVAVLVDEEV